MKSKHAGNARVQLNEGCDSTMSPPSPPPSRNASAGRPALPRGGMDGRSVADWTILECPHVSVRITKERRLSGGRETTRGSRFASSSPRGGRGEGNELLHESCAPSASQGRGGTRSLPGLHSPSAASPSPNPSYPAQPCTGWERAGVRASSTAQSTLRQCATAVHAIVPFRVWCSS
jgi:hypothetical protein